VDIVVDITDEELDAKNPLDEIIDAMPDNITPYTVLN